MSERVTLPRTPSRGGATFHPGRVREAARLLGIEGQVVVKWSQGRHRSGCCRSRANGFGTDVAHTITVSTFCDAREAGEHLWHELTHAMQGEAFRDENGGDFLKSQRAFRADYKAYGQSGNRYGHNPYEVEARENAARNDAQPLAFGLVKKFGSYVARDYWGATGHSIMHDAVEVPNEVIAAIQRMEAPAPAPRRAAAAPSDGLDTTELLRRAKNSLASTKSMLKKARAGGDAAKVAKLEDKLRSDLERVSRLQTELGA